MFLRYHYLRVVFCVRQEYVLLTQCFSTAGRGPEPGPGISYTGPQDIPLEFVILASYHFSQNFTLGIFLEE